MHTSVSQSDYWLSIAEAARRSGCSQQAVRVRLHKGQVVAMKRYGQWLVNTRSLQEFLQQKSDLALRLSNTAGIFPQDSKS